MNKKLIEQLKKYSVKYEYKPLTLQKLTDAINDWMKACSRI